jgi:homoserine dehydrogenase
VGDIVDVARGLVFPAFGQPAATLCAAPRAGASGEAAYYLRLALDDRPGTLAKVAAALGESGISIDRMRQVAHEGDVAPVLIVTHRTRRGALDAALDSIGGLAACRDAPVAIRIEDV